jgi:hypothetical protein
MPSAAVLAAVQALNGAVGSGGDALSVLRYYDMQEPIGITQMYDAMTSAPAGTWIGPPRLRGVYGPAENDSPSYGVAFVPSGPQQYGILDAGAQAMAALNGRGLFVCVAIKHASNTDRDTILSASDPTGRAGFRIALNQGGIGEPSAVSESTVFGTNITEGTAVCVGMYQNTDLLLDNQWHLHMWYMKSPGTIKHWIDGVPKPLLKSCTGASGAFPTAGAQLIAGATTYGSYTDGSAQGAFNGAMSDLMLIEGEPTQTQMRDLCRAMYYTVRGIPGVIAHYRPGPGGAFADAAMTVASVEGGPIRALKDLSGHHNDAKYDHPTDVPTLERAINGGRWTASFDNFTSNYTEWNSLGECRQQSLRVTSSPASRLVQSHMGCLVTARTLANSCFAKEQILLGFTTEAGFRYNALEIRNDEPCVERDSGYLFAQDIPKVRCLPGLGMIGFTSGVRGDSGVGDAVFINNRWQSPSASAFNTGTGATQYITQWNLADWPGQRYNGGGQAMWAGWIDEVIITRCPYVPEEGAAYVARTFAEAGEPLNPKFHVCAVGDSIASGNRNAKSRSMLGAALPVEARHYASFTNPSIGGYRVRSASGPTVSMTSRGLESPKWWDPGARNIAAVELVVNDAIDNDDEATFATDIDALIPQLRSGGANVILWNEETNNVGGPGDTPRNLAIRSRRDAGQINQIVILTPIPFGGYAADGLHLTPSGQTIWGQDWWSQGISPYLRRETLDPTRSTNDQAGRR